MSTSQGFMWKTPRDFAKPNLNGGSATASRGRGNHAYFIRTCLINTQPPKTAQGAVTPCEGFIKLPRLTVILAERDIARI